MSTCISEALVKNAGRKCIKKIRMNQCHTEGSDCHLLTVNVSSVGFTDLLLQVDTRKSVGVSDANTSLEYTQLLLFHSI